MQVVPPRAPRLRRLRRHRPRHLPAESDDESDAIAGLEQLVQASLEVQRAESGGEKEEEGGGGGD